MKRKFLFALALSFFIPQLSFGGTYFSDVDSGNEYYQAIEYLRQQGVIEGYTDGTFKPNQQSNRAETVKMLLRSANIPSPQTNEVEIFPDVKANAWYGPYIKTAKDLGIVQGNPDGLFYPGNNTNLSEFLKMLLETHDVGLGEVKSNPYADVPKERWDAPYLNAAKWLNLMDHLSSENVYPAHSLTRGEMAELIYRLMSGYHEGVASYYGSGLEGVGTSSGEILKNSDFVAAHKRLPFGSWAKITNLNNGNTVNVRIVDRGPYTDGRVVDLSQAAFQALAPLSSGVARVSVLPIADPNAICKLSTNPFIPKNAFDSITLEKDLKSSYLQGEEMILKGQVAGPAEEVSVFLVNQGQEQFFVSSKVKEGQFQLRLNLAEAGEFKVGLSLQESKPSQIYPIQVLPGSCLKNEMNQEDAPKGFILNLHEGNLILNWEKGNYRLFRLVFRQNGIEREFFTSESGFIPPYLAFSAFKAGEVELSLQGSTLSPDEFLANEKILSWSLPNSTHFQAAGHEPYFMNAKALNADWVEDFLGGEELVFRADPLVDLQYEAWVTFPNGSTKAIQLKGLETTAEENENEVMVFPAKETELSLNFIASENGVHKVEWNTDQGIAAANFALYPQSTYPLLPNPKDFPKKSIDLGQDFSSLQQQFLNLVNQDRKKNGVMELNLDSALNQLAQARAEDMVKNGYFSHWNLQGQTANDLRGKFGISQMVSENLAKESTLVLAEYDLMQSAAHRVNLLHPHWTRAGFGFAKNTEGTYTFVQLFSADPLNLADLEGVRQKTLNSINADRTLPLTLNVDLNNQAQQWSERMAKEDFFALVSPSQETLANQLQAAGITNSFRTYIVGNTSLEELLLQIKSNSEIHAGTWRELGIGLAQDEFGILKMTLVYVE